MERHTGLAEGRPGRRRWVLKWVLLLALLILLVLGLLYPDALLV